MNTSSSQKISNGLLLGFWMTTIVALSVIIFISMMMAMGVGMPAELTDPISLTSQRMWSVSGLSLVPGVGLLLLITAKQKRIFAVLLALLLIAAGLVAAAGWYINADSSFPTDTTSKVLFALVILIPVLASAIILGLASKLNGPISAATRQSG